jgi:Protein of unknown function (DUF3800)
VLFAYLDESYESGHSYWLGACLVDESAAAQLRRDFMAASASLPKGFDLPEDVELHAQHLYSGGRTFAALKPYADARVRAYKRGVEAMVNGHLVGRGLAHCLLVADEEEGTTHDVYRLMIKHQDVAARVGTQSRLRDAVFVDSRFTPGVQGADLITYLHRRRQKRNHARSQQALDAMWASLAGRTSVTLHPAPSPPPGT